MPTWNIKVQRAGVLGIIILLTNGDVTRVCAVSTFLNPPPPKKNVPKYASWSKCVRQRTICRTFRLSAAARSSHSSQRPGKRANAVRECASHVRTCVCQTITQSCNGRTEATGKNTVVSWFFSEGWQRKIEKERERIPSSPPRHNPFRPGSGPEVAASTPHGVWLLCVYKYIIKYIK